MAALGAIEPAAGIAAMNAINRAILRSAFLPIFLASSAASLALIALGLTNPAEAGALPMAAGGAIYFAGMVLVTMFGNVPLNNALAGADAGDGDGIWGGYLGRWTQWNHVRTLASFTALVLFIVAVAER